MLFATCRLTHSSLLALQRPEGMSQAEWQLAMSRTLANQELEGELARLRAAVSSEAGERDSPVGPAASSSAARNAAIAAALEAAQSDFVHLAATLAAPEAATLAALTAAGDVERAASVSSGFRPQELAEDKEALHARLAALQQVQNFLLLGHALVQPTVGATARAAHRAVTMTAIGYLGWVLGPEPTF